MGTNGTKAPHTDDRRKLRQALYALMGILGVLASCALATLMFGQISGEEFCPDGFTRRSFTYYEVPLLGLQVSPITRDGLQAGLHSYLTTKQYVPNKKRVDSEWHLVSSMRSGVVLQRGDAAILCGYLDAKSDGGEPDWQKWTDKHPDLAKALWPVVAELARRELYLFLPELFELAEQAQDTAAFDRDLRNLLARQYADFAKLQQQLEQHAAALELFEHALSYAPQDKDCQQGRAVSQAALGRSAGAPGNPPAGQK